MRQAPTLIDTLYRASFSKETVSGWTSNTAWRTALLNARRFVLDDNMSAFLGELGTQAFARPISDHKRWSRMAESLRISARLPHAITWIEYNLQKCQQRTHELLAQHGRSTDFNVNQVPKWEGWLLQQHTYLPTAFIAHIVTHDVNLTEENGDDTWVFPVALAWTTDHETMLPWRPLPLSDQSNTSLSETATGLRHYNTDRAAYVFSNLVETPNNPNGVSELMKEWAGVLRRMWALLATINDLPVVVSEVRASKGFIGKRQYRRFLDHKTITLTVPQKVHRKLARDALSMAHRRGGPVRGHWRRDWRNPLSPLCEHDFSADERRMMCGICKGRKLWITEHVRGDSSRGFATHDYVVKHEA